MAKFGRNYELKIEKKDGSVLFITLPFTIQFDITRNTLSSNNVCQIRIFNLSAKNRSFINHNSTNYGDYKQIELRAGYGENMPRIFKGNITQAWSGREGTNFITQIESFAAGYGFVTGVTNTQYPAGTPRKAIITDLTGSLPKIERGVIGSYPGVLTRGLTLSGNTAAILTEQTGGGFYVDDGKANALGTDEYIESSGLTVINSESGLLGTPMVEQTKARVDMIFEPQLNVGHKIRLESITGLNYNGDYKIVGVKHRGTISEAVAGEVVTTGEFFYTKILQGVLG